MSLDGATLLTIVGMAALTYATRVAGLMFADRLALTGRGKSAFDAIPAAVLVALIAPACLTGGRAEQIAALVTCLVATRLPLLVTILVGVASVVLLRSVLGP